jgi:hypothetical protein
MSRAKKFIGLVLIAVFILASFITQRFNKLSNPTNPPEAEAAAAGQIMVDPNNSSWFVYNRDSNGDGKLDPFFMCGAGEPEEFLYTEGTSYVQANSVIDAISGTGANAVYFQLIRTGGDIRPGQPSKQDPFVDSTSCAVDTNIIGDWKRKWLDRMDQLGITMYMFFYDDGVSTCSNNEAAFETIVDQLEGYKNLIWIVAEEYSEALSTSDVNRIAGWIQQYDDNDHPIGNHQLQGTSFDTPSLDTFAIQMNSGNLQSAMLQAWNSAQGRYNLVMSESKASFNLNTDQLRRFHWGIAMGGAYITELDWWYHGDISRAPSTQKLQNCGNLVNFMEQTTFNEMSPNDSLASGDTAYVLANPGSSYIAYTENYSSGIGLQGMSSGTYDFLWYDINNNNYVSQSNVSVGSGTQQWSRPTGITGSEVAVYLTNGGTGFTPTPTSQFTPTPTSSVNQPPVAQNQQVSTLPNQSVEVRLQFTDDRPGTYTYTITENPINGSLTGSNNDRTYTPNSGFVGTDSFKWKVNDGELDSNIATVTILVQDSLISNLSVNDTNNASNWSIQSNLQQGELQYGDRAFTFISVPSDLVGSEWIRTANASKSFPSGVLAEFNLSQPATVYIAHDDRIDPKPPWMDSWTLTTMDLVNDEGTPRTFSLYSKDFPQGTVTLRENGNSSFGMYTVVVKGSGTPPVVYDGKSYVVWHNHFGQQTGNGAADGDFNGNGSVGIEDYIMWLVNYGGSTPNFTPTPSIPNPTQTPSDGPYIVSTGAYPAIATDANNDAHVVYARGGTLWYRKYTSASGTWSNEQSTGISQFASYRNDPDIVVDSQNRPHVVGGQGNGGGQYAYWDGSQWVQMGSFNRDTALTIDANNNVYVVERGGNSGGFIGVSKRSSASGPFVALPDPTVNAENDHVYTDIFASPTDNSVHIVYRHGVPTKCAYTYSTNGGSSWAGGGIAGDDAEAPSGTVSSSGEIYAICGSGGAYQRMGEPSSWSSFGSAVGAASRHLPNLSTDSSGNLYASSFGGKYNVRTGSSWIGERTVSGVSSAAKGFMRVAGSRNGQYTYAVWEEGSSNPINDNNSDQFDIVFATINSQGQEGQQ